VDGFTDPVAWTQKRGRKMSVDSRLPMLQSSWFSPCLMVCILYYPDLIKVMLPGGKRDPRLTTAENVATGGESTLEAAVREVQEETGLVLQPAALKPLLRSCGMQFFSVDISVDI
jgi:8-oxo-dGTP pyrophosphatase MutT (NUDIX family)